MPSHHVLDLGPSLESGGNSYIPLFLFLTIMFICALSALYAFIHPAMRRKKRIAISSTLSVTAIVFLVLTVVSGGDQREYRENMMNRATALQEQLDSKYGVSLEDPLISAVAHGRERSKIVESAGFCDGGPAEFSFDPVEESGKTALTIICFNE